MICKEIVKFKFKFVKDVFFYFKFKKGDMWYEKGLYKFMIDYLFVKKIIVCYKYFFLKINLIFNKILII